MLLLYSEQLKGNFETATKYIKYNDNFCFLQVHIKKMYI